MAGPAPKTRNWLARENRHRPKGLHLIVNGLVQVTNTNKQPRLKESPERDPQHLGLALTIEDSGGPGLDVVCWKEAFFHKEVKANQFNSVTIRWDMNAIAQVPVLDDRESAQRAAAMMAAVNAKYGKASKKPKRAAPKAAPKKAASKKAKKAKKAVAKKAKKPAKKAVASRAVRTVGGWAKGVKKALRSVMGAKKKPAKKSGRRKGKKRR